MLLSENIERELQKRIMCELSRGCKSSCLHTQACVGATAGRGVEKTSERVGSWRLARLVTNAFCRGQCVTV